jgi:hypothetical protein
MMTAYEPHLRADYSRQVSMCIWLWPVAAACLLLVLAGCGRSGLYPEGQLLKNGQPFVPEQGEFVQIAFLAVAEGGGEGGSYVAGYDPESGIFSVTDGKGIPPGKYKISVQVMKRHKDALKGKFSPSRSPFVFDIQTGKEELVVDLAKAGADQPGRPGGQAPGRRR